MELFRLEMVKSEADGFYEMREAFVFYCVNGNEHCLGKGRVCLCGDGLREWFHVPEAADRIDIVFHDRPSANRCRLTRDPEVRELLVKVEGQTVAFLWEARVFLRKRFAGSEPFYVEVQYDE